MAPTRYRTQGRHNGSGSSHMWTSPGVTASLRSVANSLLLPTPIPANRLPIPGELVTEKSLRPLTVAGDRAALTWNQQSLEISEHLGQ